MGRSWPEFGPETSAIPGTPTLTPHNDPVTTTALAEPTTTPPARWTASLVLLNLAVTAGWFGPIQVLLAQQAKEIAAAGPGGLST